MIVLELLLLCDSPHLGESIFGIKLYTKFWYICCCVAVCLLDVPQKIKNPKKKLKNKNCVCTFPGPVFCIIVSAWRERELRKEGREVPSRVGLREGPIGVRITLGQPTIG